MAAVAEWSFAEQRAASADPQSLAGIDEEDDVADDGGVLVDPPDPLDLLIAHTEDGVHSRPRPLDFVRAKFQEMKKENKRLKERVADLEQTLSIVQTAQEWTVGKGMTQEQKDRMREIRALLEQAKRARADIQNFSEASKQSLYEKLRQTKAALKKERQEKAEMKDRLLHAFDHARNIKEQHRALADQRQREQDRWTDLVRDMKERHNRELRRLKGDGAVTEADRQDQLSHFGEQVIDGLSALQQHLHEVRQQTVDSVIFEGEEGAAGPIEYDGAEGADAADDQDF